MSSMRPKSRLEHRFRGENNRLDEAIDVKLKTVGQGMMTATEPDALMVVQ